MRFSLLLFLMMFLLNVGASSAYTATITEITATISTNTSSTTYEKTIGVSLKYRILYNSSVENITTVVSYVYCKVETKTLVLASDTETKTGYTNYTLISQTFALQIDEDSVAGSDLTSSSTIVIYAEIYNASISSANRLASQTTSLSYGSLISSSSSDSESSWGLAEYIILAMSALGAGIFLIWIVRWGQSHDIIPSLGLKSPRDTIRYNDGRVMWAERSRDGKFKNLVNPRRSIPIDRARTSRAERRNRRR